MDSRINKMNIVVGILAFLIVYLLLALVLIDMNGNYAFANPMVIFIAIIIGIIAFATTGICCKTKGKEKETGKKKGAK